MSPVTHPESPNSQQPPLGCLLRLFWMGFGNLALLYAAVEMARSKEVGTADVVYASVVVALLAARYIDVVKLNGLTTEAEPATRKHFTRYALILTALAVVGWLLARYVGTGS